MLDPYALLNFKDDAGLNDQQIFVKFKDGLFNLQSERVAPLLNDTNRVVLDFYRGDGTHLGFIDGGYWEVRPHVTPEQLQAKAEYNARLFARESASDSFEPSSSLGRRLNHLVKQTKQTFFGARLS